MKMAILWSGPRLERPALDREESTLSGTFVNGDEVGAHESDAKLLVSHGEKARRQTPDLERHLIWGTNAQLSRSVKCQKEHSLENATRTRL
jgi:hypothetical protein